MADLRGKHFLKDLDFSKEEMLYLLDLSKQLKAEKKARREKQRPRRAQHRAHLREDARRARAVRSKSRPSTRART